VKSENMPWKAADWGNPVEWAKRKEPSGESMWS